MNTPKFLIIRLSSIGDIILTSPVVRAIKRRFPNAEVHFLTKKQNASIVAHNPNVSRLHLFSKHKMRPLVRTLRYEHYDYIVDLHRNIRTWWLKRRLQGNVFSFHKLNVRKWLFTSFKINKLPKIHIVDRYMASLKRLNISDDSQGLDFVIPPDTTLPSFLENLPKQFVALVIGAQHATKKIPFSKLILLCGIIDCQIVALGGATEIKDGKRLSKECANVINCCGRLNIYQSAKILQQSRVVITPDTGLMHIAAALKKDIFSVWGNTVPDFGMYPYMAGGSSQIFEVKSLKCRPCSKIGYKKCPAKHFDCMLKQDYEGLARAVNERINMDRGDMEA
jgi:ADP-heptose:LPS heptosyltransferase